MTAPSTALSAVPGPARPLRGPSPLLAMADPRSLFSALRQYPTSRRALVWLTISIPLLPIVSSVLSYKALSASFHADSALTGKSAAVPFIAVLFGLVLCLVQAAMLGMHLVVFTTTARWLGANGGRKAVRAVWAYAMVPLIARQIVYLGVIAVAGMDWFRARAGLLAFADPFMVMVGVLLYLGSRKVLELNRVRALLCALSATFIGALGALLNLAS